jgi:hypothetical protein
MKILSILIPTIKSRSDLFLRLYENVLTQCDELNRLHPSLGEVEILPYNTLSFLEGGPSIGEKRDHLLKIKTW